MRAYPPLPLDARIDKAFRYAPDPEGMAPKPPGYHGAWDWFKPAGTIIYAPQAGTVIESRSGGGDISGQVFGGTVKVETPEGIVWQHRHVVPMVSVGQRVDTADPVARVSAWRDVPHATHDHLEIKKGRNLAHHIDNFIDPATVDWTTDGFQTNYYFEELPWDQGGFGPTIVGQKAGYANLATAIAAHLRVKLANPRLLIQRIKAEDGRRYLLAFRPYTLYGKKYRRGPWVVESDRDGAADDYFDTFNRRVRRFNGRARSLYPWLAED